MPERTIEDLRDAYLQQLAVEIDASPQTLLAYRKDFRALGTVLPLTTPLTAVSMTDIRTYLGTLLTRSVKTRRRRLGTIRRAFSWAIEEGWLTTNPCHRVRLPKTSPAPPPTVPTYEAMQALLTTIGSQGPHRRRDLAMFTLIYAAALREAELCGLRIGDVNLDQRSVRVLGKGRKVRVARFDEATQRVLRVYLLTRSDSQDTGRPLIISRTGDAFTPSGVRACLQRHLTTLHLPFRVWVHGLRHARATHLYGATRNLRFVQELLGHANPATTAIYTHVDMQDMYDQAINQLAGSVVV